MSHPGRPDPTDPPPPGDLPTASRAAFRTAGSLRGLAELLQAAGRGRPDGFSLDDLTRMATTLNGLSVRLALASGDAGVLSEVTGRNVVQLGPDLADLADLARRLGERAGERAGGNGPGQQRNALHDWTPESAWTPEQWADETRKLRAALGALGRPQERCLPDEPDACGEPMWSHYAMYAATLRAHTHALTEINLGKGTPGAHFAEDVYQIELDTALVDAGIRPDSTAELIDEAMRDIESRPDTPDGPDGPKG